jgi:hypothetical protein
MGSKDLHTSLHSTEFSGGRSNFKLSNLEFVAPLRHVEEAGGLREALNDVDTFHLPECVSAPRKICVVQ